MKNSKYYIFILFLAFACAKPLPKDPLVVPPDFDIMPTLDKDGSEIKNIENKNIYNQDIEDIKDLLLD